MVKSTTFELDCQQHSFKRLEFKPLGALEYMGKIFQHIDAIAKLATFMFD
jgi:hypothetical protein